MQRLAGIVLGLLHDFTEGTPGVPVDLLKSRPGKAEGYTGDDVARVLRTLAVEGMIRIEADRGVLLTTGGLDAAETIKEDGLPAANQTELPTIGQAPEAGILAMDELLSLIGEASDSEPALPWDEKTEGPLGFEANRPSGLISATENLIRMREEFSRMCGTIDVLGGNDALKTQLGLATASLDHALQSVETLLLTPLAVRTGDEPGDDPAREVSSAS